MYRISKSVSFCYGHRLLNYNGKCAHLHGHNARAVITLESDLLDASGMVEDFSVVKRLVREWLDREIDHTLLLHKDDPVLPIDTNYLHYNEISVFGAFASARRHYEQALEMVSRGDLPWGRFVTHNFKLDQITDAFDVIAAGQGIKVVIDCE